MKHAIIIFALILSTNFIFGQNVPKEYFDFVKIADSLYSTKDYKNSANGLGLYAGRDFNH